jgi:FAD/FMN-containing dehydrogenase
MTVATAILDELRGIVGKRNYSDDPAILETYRYSLSHTAIHLGPYFDVYTPRGAAVVLPGTTEEVAEIVRLCNRERVHFKASSTFWSAQGYPSQDDTVILDMRRMDRILDIDERNLFAVVEPGVIAATLQAEAMKVGLNTHIAGVGCSASILAGATSFFGSGPSNLYGGHAFDNLMAMEWITPTGDLVRTGSAGAGVGWFSGEGPGPSMRGIARGFLGSKGSMGVYTKCSVKLFGWPGPKTLPVTGTVPAYRMDLGPQFRSYTLAFPSWPAWADATQLIWEAGIGYIAHRQFNMFGRDLKYAMVKILTDPDGTLEDLEPLLEQADVRAATADMTRDFQIVVAGQTMRDMEWQEAALAEILERTGGWKVEAMLDPAIHDWSLLYLVRLGHKNLNLVFGGSYDGAFGLLGPIDFGASLAEDAAAFKLEWEKKGAIVAAGGDCMMGPIGGQGGGGSGLWENFTCFDSHDQASTEGTLEFFQAVSRDFMARRGLGVGMEAWNAVARGSDGYATRKAERDAMHLASPQPDVWRYQARIREALNPNDLGDAYYETLEDA